MTGKAYGFSPSAIDELNRQLGTQRLPARQFGLLMAVLAALLLLLYVHHLVNTAVGTAGGSAATVAAPARENTAALGRPRTVSNPTDVWTCPARLAPAYSDA